MATSIPLRVSREQSFHKVTDFEKKLEGRQFALLHEGDKLVAEVVPGFEVGVGEIFG